MKKFVILWELPKRDTETWSEQIAVGKITLMDLLEVELPQTFNL